MLDNPVVKISHFGEYVRGRVLAALRHDTDKFAIENSWSARVAEAQIDLTRARAKHILGNRVIHAARLIVDNRRVTHLQRFSLYSVLQRKEQLNFMMVVRRNGVKFFLTIIRYILDTRLLTNIRLT